MVRLGCHGKDHHHAAPLVKARPAAASCLQDCAAPPRAQLVAKQSAEKVSDQGLDSEKALTVSLSCACA